MRCGFDDHCCYVDGEVCPHLVENVAGRRWACGLRLELGSWNAVHVDPRYVRDLRPMFDRIAPDVNCGDWPGTGRTCATCGLKG